MSILRLLDRWEIRALKDIIQHCPNGDAPYWWSRATMPKLVEKGLVEPHPEWKGAWRVTKRGLRACETLNYGGQYTT